MPLPITEPFVQPEAEIRLALLQADLVDEESNYSGAFHEFIPQVTREQIANEADYAKAQKTTTLGAETHMVRARFKSHHAAATFQQLAWQAFKTPTGLLYFTVLPIAGEPQGPSNPLWSGQLQIASLDLIAAAGKKWEQTQTFPGRNITPDFTAVP